MKMNSRKMKDELTKRLERPEWLIQYDREKDALRIENRETQKGITVSIPGIVAKWEVSKEKAIDEVVYYVENALLAMEREETGDAVRILPVIRSTSFPMQAEDDNPLVTTEHTAETRIYYALDSDTTYRLLDRRLLGKLGLTEQQVREMALFNVRSLPRKMKRDEVAGNTFYFFNSNDGYDASRILDDSLLEELKKEMSGEMVVAVPHQDVLIVMDARNEVGYDVMAQMAMKFFAEGRIPITALSFIYEDKELEPVFILGKNRPRGSK
ncbi:DUF1444 domain-containing protein [Ectobacillus ponti]|uniref:UPF0354 protein NK662_02890 n=1 Tax=Ectobacillus ponti TaxID=2961894 RepID=A0AA41X2M5_9BACI|nr:DUF1444 domain-containing protein [Ectobacillus ponti]MCP8967487.1 DUF1444 domain-containing protein [Ectobacillus ponti]